MIKKILLVIVLIIIMSFKFINDSDYILLFEKANNIKLYKYGKHHYYEYFMDDKKEINGNLYYVGIRKYSFGDIDTTYIRKSDINYLQFNRITNSESVLLPITPKIGDNWLENDGSWKYEVIEEKATFKTSYKNYDDCILVKCNQLTNRDFDKDEEYLLYYSKEFGFVGNVDKEKKILSYLKEIKLNTKTGDKISTE